MTIGYPPLRPGRQMLPREFVDRYQRTRLTIALAEVVHECGISAVTVSHISKRAEMSRKTFYEFFDNKDDCVEFACEESRRHLFDPVKAASEKQEAWLDRLNDGLGAFLAAAAEEPALSELYLVHSPALPGGRGASCYQMGIDAMAELVRGGHEEAGRQGLAEGRRHEAPGVGEFVACAIVSTVSLRVKRGQIESLPELREELTRLTALAAPRQSL